MGRESGQIFRRPTFDHSGAQPEYQRRCPAAPFLGPKLDDGLEHPSGAGRLRSPISCLAMTVRTSGNCLNAILYLHHARRPVIDIVGRRACTGWSPVERRHEFKPFFVDRYEEATASTAMTIETRRVISMLTRIVDPVEQTAYSACARG